MCIKLVALRINRYARSSPQFQKGWRPLVWSVEEKRFCQTGALCGRSEQTICLFAADAFLPTPESLLVNLRESKSLVQDLLHQLPKIHTLDVEGEVDTYSALGAALEVAKKLMVIFVNPPWKIDLKLTEMIWDSGILFLIVLTLNKAERDFSWIKFFEIGYASNLPASSRPFAISMDDRHAVVGRGALHLLMKFEIVFILWRKDCLMPYSTPNSTNEKMRFNIIAAIFISASSRALSAVEWRRSSKRSRRLAPENWAHEKIRANGRARPRPAPSIQPRIITRKWRSTVPLIRFASASVVSKKSAADQCSLWENFTVNICFF